MQTSSAMGRPVQVVHVREDNTLHLDEAALKSVLLQERFKDMPVAVVSVAGKFRQGKSFLLGFFLRYLQKQGCEDWLKSTDMMTDGFVWKASPDRITTGILIWSEPLVWTLQSGTKVAVLLMDTQGTDDVDADISQDVAIFALSALLSSALVFNVRDVGKHDLDSLQLFLGYAACAAKDEQGATAKPFQALHFLVRDWLNSRTHAHGLKGGEDYFKRVTNKVQGGELRTMLKSAFNHVSCFLMPHPGKEVASDQFNGDIESVDKDFLEYVRKFVPLVLGPKNLAIKEDVGRRITVAELFPIFSEYFIFFADGKTPVPETLFTANKRKSYRNAVKVALDYFDSKVAGLETGSYVEKLEQALKKRAEESRTLFLRTNKLGKTAESDQEYLTQLEESIINTAEAKMRNNEMLKHIWDLQKEQQLQNEMANEEIRIREEEIGQMKENEIKEKEAKRKEIEELQAKHERESLEREKEIRNMESTGKQEFMLFMEEQSKRDERREEADREYMKQMKQSDQAHQALMMTMMKEIAEIKARPACVLQ